MWFIVEGNTVPAISMLSVCDTKLATQKCSNEFEENSCSVPLALPNTVLFIYNQVQDFGQRQRSGVVTSLTGNPPHNTHNYNRTRIASVLRVQLLHAVKVNWLYLGSSNVQTTKHAVQCHVQNAYRW
jgi:hypothetical protein